MGEPGSLAVAPWPSHPQDNWLEFIGAGVAAGFANGAGADVYADVKAVCRAAVERFHDQSGADEEQEWMHQLVAEAFIGPCPPGYKLVHLNGDGLDNRRVNLAYAPGPDPRPAAPLKPRPPGFPAKTAHVGKKRRKGKGKHSRH
jgi:HNH endonuclease